MGGPVRSGTDDEIASGPPAADQRERGDRGHAPRSPLRGSVRDFPHLALEDFEEASRRAAEAGLCGPPRPSVRVVADTQALVRYLTDSPPRLTRVAAVAPLDEAAATDGLVVSAAAPVDLRNVTQTTEALDEGHCATVEGAVARSPDVELRPVSPEVGTEGAHQLPRQAAALVKLSSVPPGSY